METNNPPAACRVVLKCFISGGRSNPKLKAPPDIRTIDNADAAQTTQDHVLLGLTFMVDSCLIQINLTVFRLSPFAYYHHVQSASK